MDVTEMRQRARNEIEIMMNAIEEGAENKEIYNDHCMAAYRSFFSFLNNVKALSDPSLVKALLLRLLNEKPLTPIEDVEEEWVSFAGYDPTQNENEEEFTVYQSKRYPPLFKKVEGGKVTYTDMERQVCVDIKGGDNPYYQSPFAKTILDEAYPITMPYYPNNDKIKIYTEDWKVFSGDHAFDTLGILCYRTPDGQIKDVKRFFKRNPDTGKIIEIDKKEFYERKKEFKEGGSK